MNIDIKTTIQEEDGKVIAFLEGRFDTIASPEVEKALSPLFECKDKEIILDCSGLTYIASAGLRLFLSVLKSAQGNGSRVFIRGINDHLRTVFAMTGFINIFKFI